MQRLLVQIPRAIDLWRQHAGQPVRRHRTQHTVVDGAKFGCWVDRVAALDPSVIVGAHGPMLSGRSIDAALERMRHLQDAPLASMPGQDVLEQLIAMFDRPALVPA